MEKGLLTDIINTSRTYNEVLIKLGKNTSSRSYEYLKKLITEYDIDISHFLSKKEIMYQLICHGKIKKLDFNEIFKEQSMVGRGTLKRRILSDNLIKYECCFCGNNGEWLNKKISLILDHINGVNNDNRLENLRFLCPNCNSSLDTHCKGSKGYELKNKIKEKEEHSKNNRKKDRVHTRKVERPPIDVLLNDVAFLGFRGTGRKYGVSDNSIRKWIKRLSNQS